MEQAGRDAASLSSHCHSIKCHSEMESPGLSTTELLAACTTTGVGEIWAVGWIRPVVGLALAGPSVLLGPGTIWWWHILLPPSM